MCSINQQSVERIAIIKRSSVIKSLTPNLRYRWAILGVCWLAYATAFLQRLSIGPLAPFLKENLFLTHTQIGLLMSASAIGYGLTLIPAGWLVDRIGVRRILVIGAVTGGISIAAMSSITSFSGGFAFMILAGASASCILPSTTKAILIWFPVRERATVMGLKQTGVNAGGIIGAITLPALALA
ncbi:MFS transporter, partial [Chloroflexota bacterium]